MKIETTVVVRMTNHRGEVDVHERSIIADTGDNPRFIAQRVESEVSAAAATVVSAFENQYGAIPREVEACPWCPNPGKPSAEHHPDRRAEHRA